MTHQLAIVGTLPPPYGGVSIHVERLLLYLERSGVDYVVYNLYGRTEIPDRVVSVAARRKRWFLGYLFFGKEPVVFLVTGQWLAWAGGWFLSRARGKKCVICMQGLLRGKTWDSIRPLQRWCLRRIYASAARIVVPTQQVHDFVTSAGDFGDKTLISPAFIPPLCRSEDEDLFMEEAKTFCAEHDPVVLATGAARLRQKGTDLYGIDMTIELVDRLRVDYPKIGVMWSLLQYAGATSEYEDKLRRQITDRGLDDHWLFTPPQDVFHPAYKLADVLVRPTLTDGDAISVREALFFGVPTIASDVAPRPEGTILFRGRDQEDFERTVRRTLETLQAERERIKHLHSTTTVEEEVALLQDVVTEATG